jgi:hypothetical protein
MQDFTEEAEETKTGCGALLAGQQSLRELRGAPEAAVIEPRLRGQS